MNVKVTMRNSKITVRVPKIFEGFTPFLQNPTIRFRPGYHGMYLKFFDYNMKGLLEFNPTTINDVRKEYNLDKLGMMEQAIDILHDWIQKQDHFLKKNIPREYLERVIISTKGSVERAKSRVDKMCTFRTTVPELFTKINVKQDLAELPKSYVNVYMPKLTKDNYRIYIIKMKSGITSAIILDSMRHNMILGEYLKRNDYSNGIIVIFDFCELNMMEFVAQVNFVDWNNASIMYTEGFGFRVKNIIVISPSKVVDVFVNILRQILSAKLGQRITVLKTREELDNYVPKELLPEDFGGQQLPLKELYDKWTEELSSEDHIEYLKEMIQARTNEELRKSDRLDSGLLGTSGTFKTLLVD